MTDPDGPAPPPKTRADGYGANQLYKHMGITYEQFQRAREQGLIPAPQHPGRTRTRWTQQQADDLAARAREIVQMLKPYPIGAGKVAALLAERTGLDVQWTDVQRLSEMSLLPVVDWFTKGRRSYALYDPDQLVLITDDVIDDVVADRELWIAGSVPEDELLARLGWTAEELAAVAAERRIRAGRLNRWAVEDVDALTSDPELDERVRGERQVTSDRGATILEIRLTDFRHMVDAGWIPRVDYVPKEIGRGETVEVPLYRVADIEAMREQRFVDWDALHDAEPGQKSPLLVDAWARKQIIKGREVQRLADELGTLHGIDVEARLDTTRHHFWRLRWPTHAGRRRTPTPTAWEVGMIIATDPRLEPWADDIVLEPYDPAAPTPTTPAGTTGTGPTEENA
ncbi:hypothetical protein [Saccharothrix sp. HUAS TT1]|uniref:hypothetical protein n=1 Tax=unclassified Saccharothrix TaxID=2593673 RepID=UPI00345B9A85